ncbi:hypothetical protein E2C01_020415 [Portunus trituberculatus]|uniref:Uncharacterized protein n=1 Tax=Portunus trituberculatus TaxID=210409 RepID=A0A5B7E0E8_PORTR|nr:hypothetical protein [Portunus trituberculatus]
MLPHLVIIQQGEVDQLGLKWHKCHCLKAQHAFVKEVGTFTHLSIQRHHRQNGLQADAPLIVLVVAGL